MYASICKQELVGIISISQFGACNELQCSELITKSIDLIQILWYIQLLEKQYSPLPLVEEPWTFVEV